MITIKDVEYIASLAKLHYSEEEKQSFIVQFNKIIEYMNILNKIDTTKVQPLLQVIELNNVFREDKVSVTVQQEDILKNAPEKKGSFFKIPRTIGDH